MDIETLGIYLCKNNKELTYNSFLKFPIHGVADGTNGTDLV